MAKGAYIGVGGVARKAKKGYVGVDTEVPIYGDPVSTSVTVSNIAEFFDVKNDNYYFKGSGGTFANTNGGVANSTAKTTLTAKVDMEVSFYYSYSSEAKYDKFSLVFGTTTVESEVSGAKTTKSYSGKLSVGESIVFTYTKDGSQDGNDDRCAFSTIVVKAASIIGTETKGVARKIKKAYIGIGGVARPCWGGGKLVYYGTVTSLNQARNYLAATTVGNYALFGGGSTGNYSSEVDAYDTSLTHTTPTSLSTARNGLAATTVGNYALFGGGTNDSTYRTEVDAYSTSLTRTTKYLYNSSVDLAATTVGNYALFGGGYGSNAYEDIATVNAFNTSLTRTLPTKLSDARRMLAATTVGNYALFGGGAEPNSNVVDAYDTSLTHTTPTALSAARGAFAATTVGNYALFGGGNTSDVVDAYDTSLTRTTPTVLSVSRRYLTATTVGDYAIFGGGLNSANTPYSTVDAYDTSLTRTIQTELCEARYGLAATTIGDYALFGGGYMYSTTGRSYKVDTYTIV